MALTIVLINPEFGTYVPVQTNVWVVCKVITKGVMSRCPLDNNSLLASRTSVILWRFVMLANIRAPQHSTHMNKTRAATLPFNSNIMLYVPTMRKQSTNERSLQFVRSVVMNYNLLILTRNWLLTCRFRNPHFLPIRKSAVYYLYFIFTHLY